MESKKNFPDNCPVCGKVLEKEIVRLESGGFLYEEACPVNETHYRHYRHPTFLEIQEFNS